LVEHKTQLIGFGLCLLAGMLVALDANATSVTYYLDDTNVAQFNGGLPDGTNYLTVTIDDEGGSGGIGGDSLIRFTVDVIDGALTPINMFGIQSFAFNITGDAILLTTDNIIGLPNLWDVSHFNNTTNIKATNGDGYGKFDVLVSDGGQSRQDPLVFSVDVAGDSIASYFDLSDPTNPQSQPNVAFAAHVTGISTGAYTLDANSANEECDPLTDGSTCMELPSAWFGGPVAAVPVPAAVWLFGSGLLALSGVVRRKKT
jgi:hypothetical protein